MPGKQYTAEQVVAKLREAEKLQARATIPQVCKKLGVSEQTFFGGASSTARSRRTKRSD